MDALDLLKPREKYVLTGGYRNNKDERALYFDYQVVNAQSANFSSVINDLIAMKEGLVIKTMWDCGFAVGGLITTHDGKLWEITQIQMDNGNSESLRYFNKAPTAEFVIALIGVMNERGLLR